MVVIVLFALEPNFYAILGIVVVLAASMFIPLKFIHPVRTERWRLISLPVSSMFQSPSREASNSRARSAASGDSPSLQGLQCLAARSEVCMPVDQNL